MAFDKEIISERIQIDNVWWESGKIPFFQNLGKRGYYLRFYEEATRKDPHRALVMMGPRRVGKTVMMYQMIQQLIDGGTDPKTIFYFSLDTSIFTRTALRDLFEMGMKVNNVKPENAYVFFDEIQYLRDWEIHLKSLVDNFRETQFIASGSAAAALRMKSIESGAGRFSDFFLPPLTFSEYIDLKGNNDLLEETQIEMNGPKIFYKTDDITALNRQFREYIYYGGFPEIALAKTKITNPERYIQQDITDKVIMKDLPGLFGIDNVLDLQQFFNVLAYRTAEIQSYQSISSDTGADNKTIKKYIEYLEAAFLVRRLLRVDVNAKRFKNITQFKMHLNNPSLFTGLFGKISEQNERFPYLVETAIFAQFPHLNDHYLRYAHWKNGEVDLIELNRTMQDVLRAIEIKWSDGGKPAKLFQFMRKNLIPKGILTTKTVFENQKNLLKIPSAAFAYTVGKRILAEI